MIYFLTQIFDYINSRNRFAVRALKKRDPRTTQNTNVLSIEMIDMYNFYGSSALSIVRFMMCMLYSIYQIRTLMHTKLLQSTTVKK